MSNNMPKSGEFCWNELSTGDVSEAKKFYSELFDWQINDVPMGDFTYTMMKSGDKEIAGIVQSQQQGAPSQWMSYVKVDNLEDTVTKAQKLGAEVKVPATTVGEMGKLAVIQDPAGAEIALWQQIKSN